MIALASSDHRQPFYSFGAGDTAQNHHNEPTEGRMLGTELNWSVNFGAELPLQAEGAPKLNLNFEVQGGHFLVGSALRVSSVHSEVTHHLQMTGRFRW